MADLLALIVGALGAALGLVFGLAQGRARGIDEGRKQAEAEADADTIERMAAGRNRMRDGRGADPDERLRNNDGRW